MKPQVEIEYNAFDAIKEKNDIPKRSYRKDVKEQYLGISVVIIIVAVIIITSIIIPNRSNSHLEPKKPQNYEGSHLIIRTNDSILNYDYKTNKVHFSQKLHHLSTFEVLGNKVFWSTTDFPKIVNKKNASIDDQVENMDVIFQEGRVNPTAMSLDFITDKLYVVDKTAGTVIIIDLKSKKYGLCLSDLLNPQEVVLDPIHGYMFLLQFSKNILRANMDGSDLDIVQNGTITTMTLDIEAERIYWVKDLVHIESSDYFGKNTISCLKYDFQITIISLTIIDRQLFWLWPANDHRNSTLLTCEIRSTGRCKNHHNIQGIDFHNATYLKSYSTEAKNSTYNLCSLHNGGCQHLCLRTSSVNSGRTCACYLGWQTGSDPRTCERVRDGFIFTSGDFIRIKILSVNNKTSFTDAILPTHFEAGITKHKSNINFVYDSIRQEFYWSDDSSIFKKSLRQAEETVTLQVSEPDYVMHDLVMDWVSGNMYYSKGSIKENDHKIMVFSIANSTYQRTLLSIKYSSIYGEWGYPRSMVVDPIKGVLYFAAAYAVHCGSVLFKSTISGSELTCIKHLHVDYNDEYRVLAMDHRQNVMYKLYHYNSSDVIIYDIVLGMRMTYSGDNLYVHLSDVKTIDVHQDWFYLTTQYSIWRADKTTGKNLTMIWPPSFYEAHEKVSGVRVIDPDVEAAYKKSFCSVNNGGCQQLCFSAPTKTCNCSDGQTVQNDGSCFNN